jgi:hypothetical protein
MADLRTGPSSGQAAISSLLRHPSPLPATQGQRSKNQKNAHRIGMCHQTKTTYLRWRSTRSISCSKDAATAAT